MSPADYNIRPLTEADVLTVNDGNPCDRTLRGFAIEYNGKLAAVAGLMYDHGRMVFFSDIKEDVEAPKITIWRISKEIVRRIKEWNLTSYAGANQKKENSEQYLKRLGFTFADEIGGIRIFKL